LLIKYKTSLDDFLALGEHHYRTSPVLQRSLFINKWIFPFLYLLIGIYGYFKDSQFLMLVGLFAFIWPGVISSYHRRLYLKRMTKLYLKGGKQEQVIDVELSFDNTGITIRRDENCGNFSWGTIKKVVSTEDHTFIYTSDINALVIPRVTITDGDYSTFVRELKNKVDSKKDD